MRFLVFVCAHWFGRGIEINMLSRMKMHADMVAGHLPNLQVILLKLYGDGGHCSYHVIFKTLYYVTSHTKRESE